MVQKLNRKNVKKVNLLQSIQAGGATLEDGEKTLVEALEKEINTAFEDLNKGLLREDAFRQEMEKLQLKASAIMIGEGDKAKSIDQYLRELGTTISELKASNETQPVQKSYQETVKEFIARVKEAKKNNPNSPFSVSLDKDFDKNEASKAAVTMTSSNTTANAQGVVVPANYMYGVEGTPEPDVRVTPYITQFLDNGNTDMPALPYADKLPTEGTMAITAEGALKPLLSVAIERRFSTAFKIAGRSKVTEEALDDISGLQALINGELRYSHDIAEQSAVFTHVAAFAPAFVAGNLAATTEKPSNWDAVRAAIYAIKIASKNRFIPNVVVLNSADAYAMGATKDSTGQYVMPPFVMPDGTTISGVRVLETQDEDNVAAGEFIVGDWRKVKRRVYKPFNIRVGQGIVGSNSAGDIVSDFESNLYTIIGESRLHLWHYKNDETAFVKTDFDTVKEAIDSSEVQV